MCWCVGGWIDTDHVGETAEGFSSAAPSGFPPSLSALSFSPQRKWVQCFSGMGGKRAKKKGGEICGYQTNATVRPARYNVPFLRLRPALHHL